MSLDVVLSVFLSGFLGVTNGPPCPHIKQIALEGTNIAITVSVDAGFERLVLEGGSSGSSNAWQPRASIPVEQRGGDFVFRLPRLAQAQLLRVRADSPAQTTLSSELSYVAASAQSIQPITSEVVLRIRGKIDGTDKIIITREGAVWEHMNWDWPQSTVWFNDIDWIPREKNIITASGAAGFLPEEADLSAARLERVRCRDIVALERSETSLAIHLGDTLLGADDYEFRLHVPLRDSNLTTQNPGAAATLKVKARIDGSDQLRITASDAQWKHRYWDWPGEVWLNQVKWVTGPDTTTLPNEGPTRFLPADINFATARVIDRKGRDLAAAEATADALVIHFADNLVGADDYAITVQFGP